LNVIGVDPGPEKTAYVCYNGESISDHEIIDNAVFLTRLECWKDNGVDSVLVVERISMGGMIAGPEVFETCFWSGRFVEMWSPRRWDRVKRIDVKHHICHTHRANDSVIRQMLIERFGPGTERAIGKKKTPGPLYGIASHEWAALAVAVTWFDKQGHLPQEIRPGVVPDF
jgi:hypothetical protein